MVPLGKFCRQLHEIDYAMKLLALCNTRVLDRTGAEKEILYTDSSLDFPSTKRAGGS